MKERDLVKVQNKLNYYFWAKMESKEIFDDLWAFICLNHNACLKEGIYKDWECMHGFVHDGEIWWMMARFDDMI